MAKDRDGGEGRKGEQEVDGSDMGFGGIDAPDCKGGER